MLTQIRFSLAVTNDLWKKPLKVQVFDGNFRVFLNPVRNFNFASRASCVVCGFVVKYMKLCYLSNWLTKRETDPAVFRKGDVVCQEAYSKKSLITVMFSKQRKY